MDALRSGTPPLAPVVQVESRLEQTGDTSWTAFYRSTPQGAFNRVNITVQDEQRFRQLADEWIKETALDSDPVDKFLHPAHFKIVGMGTKILPLILREVEKMNEHWFVALDAISTVNPVTAEDETSLERTAQAWLSWGREENLI